MNVARNLTWLMIVTAAASGVLAQGTYYEYEDEARPKRKPAVPAAGFWPTPRMMEHLLDRLVDQKMAPSFGFDEEQTYVTQEILRERIIPWLNDHRAEIMCVTNDFLEAWLDGEPPDPEWVAKWSQRALPLLDQFSDVVEEVSDEIRPYLTEEQETILEGHLAAFRVGTSFTARRLGVWSEGGFDPATDWHRSPQYKPAEADRHREVSVAVAEAQAEVGYRPRVGATGGAAPAAGDAPGQPAARTGRQTPARPPDAWARYVDDFVRRYALTPEQQARAYKTLHALQEQRDRYLRRNERRFAEAEQILRHSDSPRERAQAERVLAERAKTLDHKFTMLKDKLEKLPTRKQRLAATNRNPVRHAANEQASAKRESPSSP